MSQRRRWQFRLLTLFAVILAISVILALRGLYWRFIATPSLGNDANVIRCQPQPDALPYRIGDPFRLRDLNLWLGSTRPCLLMSSQPDLECTLEVGFKAGECLRISAFGGNSSSGDDGDNKAFILWKGHVRSGDLSELQAILLERRSLADWEPPLDGANKVPLIEYRDTNSDGSIDRKAVSISSEEWLVWQDTNSDGYFDQEYILYGATGRKYDQAQIQVRVPDAQ